MSKTRETVEKFLEIKKQLSELEKRHEKYRKWIESYMEKEQMMEIEHDNITIKLTKQQRESVSKKDLPPEVWSKYAKRTSFNVIKVSKKGDKEDRDDEKE